MSNNHLRNRGGQGKILTVAFGRQIVTGHLCWSRDVSPGALGFNALGEGEWEACDGAFYEGEIIGGYQFHPGALATSMDVGAENESGTQKVDPFFPLDVPHSRTATIGYLIPEGMTTNPLSENPPTGFKGIFRTKKCPDFDASGTKTDFSYSTNPAREIIELLLTYCRLPNLPAAYASFAHYWISRIDWENWTAFRDFHDFLEPYDYRTLENFDGFGLTARYYAGVNLVNTDEDDFAQKFVHPNFDIEYSAQPPAFNVPASNFSAKFTGFIKFPKSETFTFTLTFDDSVRFWLDETLVLDYWNDNGNGPPIGTRTFTFNATAGEYVPVVIHWNEGFEGAALKIEWESATTAKTVLPSKYLYPEVEQRPRYEVHIDFELPVHPAAAIREILFQSNSFMTEARGKLLFFAYEQLTLGQSFDRTNIDSLRVLPTADRVQTEIYTAYEAAFRSLDLQYIEEPVNPVSIEFDYPSLQPPEKSKVIQMFNTTHWQAFKVLNMRAKLDADRFPQTYEIKTTMAKSYKVIAGDLVEVSHRKISADRAPRTCLVTEVINAGVQENQVTTVVSTEPRTLILKEFNA